MTKPAAIPISPSRSWEQLVFISGQLGFDPHTGDVPDDYEQEVHVALQRLISVAQSSGASVDTVLKTTVFITEASRFAAMNSIYESVFCEPYPARSTVVTALAHPSARFEIEAIAHVVR